MDVVDWLLDSDPAIRWQVLRDVVHAPEGDAQRERGRVAHEGWGARLLGLQGDDGQWDGGACFPASGWNRKEPGQPWTSTLPVLSLLQEFGVDPTDERVRRAIAGVRSGCKWEHAKQPFFEGEVEPCINGRTVSLGVYFGLVGDATGVVTRMLTEQLDDGGWNCEVENGSVVSSFATTINVLEGLLLFEQATGGSAQIAAVRRAGEEYLLDRKLMRRKSTGEIVDEDWLQFSFPVHWFYDVLRALDYFRSTGQRPDPRMAESVELVWSKRQPDGRWLLENTHPGKVPFELEDGDGQPSRWNTLRAMRVLAWAEGQS